MAGRSVFVGRCLSVVGRCLSVFAPVGQLSVTHGLTYSRVRYRDVRIDVQQGSVQGRTAGQYRDVQQVQYRDVRRRSCTTTRDR